LNNNNYPAQRSIDFNGNGNQPKGLISVRPAKPVPRSARPNMEEEDQLITPRLFLRAIVHWWWIAGPSALVLAVLASAVIWYLFKPVYRASVVIRVAKTPPRFVVELNKAPEDSEEFVQTQIELIRSRLVLGPVLGRPEIAPLPEVAEIEDPIDRLADKLRVTQVGHSELYQISYDSTNSESSALIANAVVDEYFNLRAQDDAARNQRVIELLEQEKQRRAGQVHILREKMRELAKQVLGKDPFIGTPTDAGLALTSPLSALQERLTTTEVEAKILEAQITALEESTVNEVPPPAPESMVELGIEDSQEIRDLNALIANKRATLHRIELVAARGTDDPSYQRLAKEINHYEQSLQRARAAVRPQVAEKIKTFAASQRKDQLSEMRTNLEVQRLLEDMLRERYEKQLNDMGKSGDQSLELEFTRTELAREEKVFEMIAERAMSLQTEMRAPGRVTLMKRAVTPLKPVEPLPLRNLTLAIFASFCLPFGVAVLWEHSIRRISNSEQLERHAQLYTVAEVVKLPLRTRVMGLRPSRRTLKDVSLFEESIDSLRTSLVLPEDFKNLRVLAVASAIHGEGKTSVASQLAVSIARSCGERTLLIDADMRLPDIHRIFQIPNEPGLSKVLDHLYSVEEAIDTSWSEYVHFLPAGKLHKSPHNLLGSGALDALLDTVRASYRYIIIDTPPILSASEALVIAKAADGTILCARRGYSREAQIRIAHERLAAAGAQTIGAVLNAVPTRQYAHRYGSYAYAREQ
jgi:capsular exopolysaccharide synthesis family protein